MPVSEPTLDPLPIQDAGGKKMAGWPRSWATFFTQVWLSLLGWTKTYYAIKSFDFGLIAAQSQATTTVTVDGARTGDSVLVRPSTAVNGIILDGSVTTDNTVTIRAVNYSAGGIDPALQTYMVIVFQQ